MPASPTITRMIKARRSAMFMAISLILFLLSQARMVCSSRPHAERENELRAGTRSVPDSLRFRRQNFVSFRQALDDFCFVAGDQAGLHGLLLRLVPRQIDVRGFAIRIFE